MNEKVIYITPELCPLCNKSNNCGNISCDGAAQSCWCNESTIRFSDTLLKKIPDGAKNKACICKACALTQH